MQKDEFDQRFKASFVSETEFDQKRDFAFPDLVNGIEIQNNPLPLPPQIIAGLISRGEKGELAGGSKSFKTWALINQAIAIAAGKPWWKFATYKTPVIFLNLEIPRPFFEQRVRDVASALGVSIPETFYVLHLRSTKLGNPDCWNAFLVRLKELCSKIPNPFLTSDPIYKLLGGRNENSAGDVSQLLSQLDEMVELMEGSNFFGHHYSKGNQSSKEAIDRAAGSGVFQRDPDSILTMTAHKNESAFTVDSIIRNHIPVEPFCVAWKYPLFEVRGDLDPVDLKAPKTPSGPYKAKDLAELLANQELRATAFQKIADEERGPRRTEILPFWNFGGTATSTPSVCTPVATNSSWDSWENFTRILAGS